MSTDESLISGSIEDKAEEVPNTDAIPSSVKKGRSNKTTKSEKEEKEEIGTRDVKGTEKSTPQPKPPPRRRAPPQTTQLMKEMNMQKLIEQDRLRHQIEKQRIKDIVKKQLRKKFSKYKVRSDSSGSEEEEPVVKKQKHIDFLSEPVSDDIGHSSSFTAKHVVENPYTSAIYPNLHQVRR